MADYICKVADSSGRVFSQVEAAQSVVEARQKLSDRGLFVYSIKSRGGLAARLFQRRSERTVSGDDFLVFNQQVNTLIKAGLPDGSDRPLVYSLSGAKDGLFFRTNQPAYSFYTGDGSHKPESKQKQGGQFRDVASWALPEGTHNAPATRPLE